MAVAASVVGSGGRHHREFLRRLVPAIRLDGNLHMGGPREDHFTVVRRVPYEKVMGAQRHEMGFADPTTQQFYEFKALGIHSTEELRARQMKTEERRELLINLVTRGHSVNEALWIVESDGAVMASVRKHEPHNLAWHPVDQKISSKINRLSNDDPNSIGGSSKANVFNSDLPGHVRSQIQWPEEGKRRSTSYDPIRAHYGRGEYAKRKKAPTPTGRLTDRPRPEISLHHVDFLTHAAKHADTEGDWYHHIKPMVQHIFDSPHYKDSHMVMSLLAAGSPQTHPHLNVLKSMRAYRDLIQGKPLVGSKSETDNYVRAAHGLDLSGPKVHAYNRNIHGDFSIPTNDRHMKHVNLSDYNSGDLMAPEHHAAVGQATREVARRLKWPAAKAQAALWHHHIRRAGLNHPSFHEPNSPFRHYSTNYGGWLEPTEHEKPVQDYGQFMYHPGNFEALTHIKKSMDEYRLNHPHFSKMAGSHAPFLFSASTHGGATKYGKDITDHDFSSALGNKGHAMVDLGNRDITKTDPETGWTVRPSVVSGPGKVTRPKKLVPVSFLKGQ